MTMESFGFMKFRWPVTSWPKNSFKSGTVTSLFCAFFFTILILLVLGLIHLILKYRKVDFMIKVMKCIKQQ